MSNLDTSIARIFIALLLLVGPAFPARSADKVPALVTDISERDYFSAVHREIREAKESIVVVSDMPGGREDEPLAPWWTLSLIDISRKYTNAKTRSTMNAAMLELERQDILQVSRDWPEKGEEFSQTVPNIYRLKDLLSPEEIEKAWKAMEDEHGKEKVKEARKLAAMLDRPNSWENTRSFLYCIVTYGLDATEAETRKVAKLAPQNPYRHVR